MLDHAGGTMETVIEEVLNRGGSESFTKVISVVAAPEALRRLSPNYPSTRLPICFHIFPPNLLITSPVDPRFPSSTNPGTTDSSTALTSPPMKEWCLPQHL